MSVPVAVWQPCELLCTCYLLTYLLASIASSSETRAQFSSVRVMWTRLSTRKRESIDARLRCMADSRRSLLDLVYIPAAATSPLPWQRNRWSRAWGRPSCCGAVRHRIIDAPHALQGLRNGWVSVRTPRTVTDKLQQVLNAAARVITGTRKFQVWSRSWSDTARPTALARRSRSGSFQACSNSSPVSERPRTTTTIVKITTAVAPSYLSVGALHPGLQCWHAAASAFRQPSPTCRTAFVAQHLRPSGVFSCWPDGLELTPGFYPGSNEQHRLF